MLEPFSNTLEDHAKHKVRELGCVPLFPTLLRPLELCHQLINEHNAISFPLSLSQYVIWSFSIHFMLRHRSLNPWIVWGSECVVSGSFLLCDCMYASSIWTHFIMIIFLKTAVCFWCSRERETPAGFTHSGSSQCLMETHVNDYQNLTPCVYVRQIPFYFYIFTFTS